MSKPITQQECPFCGFVQCRCVKNFPDSNAPKTGGVIDRQFESNQWTAREIEKINKRLEALESKESSDAEPR